MPKGRYVPFLIPPYMTLKIVNKSVSALLPYARNARTHSEEQVAQIAASIREFGFTNPVLVDEKSEIIAGHGRVMGAEKLGMDEVPCVELFGWSEERKKAYRIADNKLALNAGWDEKLLRLEIHDLMEAEFDVLLTGFSADEVEDLLVDPDSLSPDEGEDDIPGFGHVPKTKRGDVWLLGSHRLMCGDSTNAADVAALMDGCHADLFLTDPPYNVDYVGKTKEAMTIQNDRMDDDSFRAFLRDAFVCADAHMRPGAAFYIWHADSEGYNFRGACRDVKWTVRQCLIWVKDTMVMGRQDYQWKHEPSLYGSKSGGDLHFESAHDPSLYGWKDGAAHQWMSDRKQTTVLQFERQKRNDLHPTMKPVALIEYQVLNSSKPNNIVLDLFAGSGTLMIACEKTKRRARLMEVDALYCDVIVKRFQEFSGKKAALESTGELFDDIESGQ